MTINKNATVLASILAFTGPAWANVVGGDVQNFNPTQDGLDFVTVHSSETLLPKFWNLGLFVNYATNTLPYFEKAESSSSRKTGLSDTIVGLDLNVGYGFTSRFEGGLSTPFVIDQSVKSGHPHGEFETAGNTEFRVYGKYRFSGDRRGGFAGILSGNFNQIENNPYAGNEAGPTINVELAADTTMGLWAVGVNLGYRHRDPGKPIVSYPIKPLPNQYIGSLALSALLDAIDSKLILEVFGSSPTGEDKDGNSNRSAKSLEALLGLKHDLTRSLALHLGAGSELSHSVASPDLRIYTGINWVFGPKKLAKKQKMVQYKKRSRRQRPKKRQDVQPLPDFEAQDFSDVTADNPPAESRLVAPDTLDDQAVIPVGEYPSDADETFVFRDVHFIFDSDFQVLKGAQDIMQEFVAHVNARGFKRIVIEGHTDYVGSNEYNFNLGARRARSIYKHLLQTTNFNPQHLTVRSFGETRPVADNGNYQGRLLNRRVVFRVYY